MTASGVIAGTLGLGRRVELGTPLAEKLNRARPRRVLVTGWAIDFCVDATVRSSINRDHHVVAVSDAHTLIDRPHFAPDQPESSWRSGQHDTEGSARERLAIRTVTSTTCAGLT
jgi:nicotinamidase-related amidase